MNRETRPAPKPGDNDQDGATAAQLKADLRLGRSDGQGQVFDPGLSMLGTDDEAGGHPMTPQDIALARDQETRRPKSFEPRAPATAAAGAPEQATATSIPNVAISEDALYEGSETRFSPALAIAVIGGAAAVAAIFAMMT